MTVLDQWLVFGAVGLFIFTAGVVASKYERKSLSDENQLFDLEIRRASLIARIIEGKQMSLDLEEGKEKTRGASMAAGVRNS